MNTQEAKQTLEFFSRYEIAEPKVLEQISDLIEQKIRDKNTRLADAITYLLIARRLNLPELNQIASDFYYNQDYQGLLDFHIEDLKRNGTIKERTTNN